MNIAKKITSLSSILALLLLSACGGLTNLTPTTVPENSSRVYTLSFSAYINDGSIVPGTLEPFVVIDGEEKPMKIVSGISEQRVFEYDYTLPKGRTNAKYYFYVKYMSDMGSSGIIEKRIQSPTLYELNVITRYVVNAQSDRGCVGAAITILGSGFDRLDKVVIGGVDADTEFVSRTTMSFIVPPIDAGKNYDLEIVSQSDRIWVGSFRVDASDMRVSPAAVVLDVGDSVNMIFEIGFKAPEEGYQIDVKTNIPSAVVMPEVVVPAGQTSISVPVEFVSEAKGAIYVNAKGFNEKVIPVEITISESSVKAEAKQEK